MDWTVYFFYYSHLCINKSKNRSISLTWNGGGDRWLEGIGLLGERLDTGDKQRDCQEGSTAAFPDSTGVILTLARIQADRWKSFPAITTHRQWERPKVIHTEAAAHVTTKSKSPFVFFYWPVTFWSCADLINDRYDCDCDLSGDFCGWLPLAVGLPLVWGRPGAGCLAGPACCGWPWQRRSEPRTWRPCSAGLCPSLPGP